MTESSSRPEAPVVLTVEADPHLHYALQRMGVLPVKRVSLHNTGGEDLESLELEVTLGAAATQPWVRRLDRLRAGTTHNFDRVELVLDAQLLRRQRERVATVLSARVHQGGVVVAAQEIDVVVCPPSEWPGARTLPEVLAAFVLPTDPVVADLLTRAAVHLRTATGNASLDGYQSRDPARARAIVRSIHDALRELSVARLDLPVGFERDGIAVRLPDEVVRERRATSLDSSLLFAAALEQAGLNPLLVLVRGHVFAGAWTAADCFAEAALEDGLPLRKRADLEEVLLVDVATAAADGRDDFDAACRSARRLLNDLEPFGCVIDVARSRRLGVLPLPVESRATVDATPALAPATAGGGPVDAAPPKAPAAGAEESPAGRLDRWKRKLLDLSLRNRLINFRPTKLALRLSHDDPAELEDALASGADFVLRPAPADERRRERDPAASAADDDARRRTFLADELRQRRLHTALGKDDLEARLVEIWRHARLAREESGANVLFLALGMLRFYETPASDQVRSAPLLLVPLQLDRVSAREGFRLRLGEDEPRLNVTLLEKLAVEFQIQVEGFDELTEDDSGVDVRAVLQRFRRAVRDIDRWDVVDEAWIAPFSFAKFLMWRDLEEQRDALLASPVLRHLVQRPGASFEPEAPFPEGAHLDQVLPARDALCPLDADSSQLAAVAAAAAGRSFVLAGPPGTGKSQTIANLIAHCVAHGRRVLFVAEKMAALDVVRARLRRVGLGPFCLELHSKESSKRAVLDSLQQALDVAEARAPAEWDELTGQLEGLRAGLNAYVEAMHRERAPGESVFAATSALIGLRDAPRVVLAPGAADTLDRTWVAERRELVDILRAAAADLGALATHPLRHVRRGRFETTLPDRASQALTAVRTRVEAAAAAGAAVEDCLGVDPATLPWPEFAACDELVRCVLATPGTFDLLITEPAAADLRPELQGAIDDARRLLRERGRVREAFDDAVLAQDLDGLLARLRAGMASWWPLSLWRCRAVRATLRPFARWDRLGSNAELAQKTAEAIAVRDLAARLARDDHPGARFFGQSWCGGEPGTAGLDHLQAVLAWAERMRAALRVLTEALGGDRAAPIRRRALDLAGRERDALAPAAGDTAGREPSGSGGTADRLRAFVAAVDALAAARADLEQLLDLDPASAWQPRAAGSPFFAHCAATVTEMAAALEDLPAFCHWRRTREQAVAKDLMPLVAALEDGGLTAEQLGAAFERAHREAFLAATCDGDDLLREFAGREHERRIQRFAELDARLLTVTSELVRARLAARVPRGAGAPAAGSELGILLRELAKKSRYKPLRRLFAETENLLPLLKPCFLMSPLSVAQYLAPGHAMFDLVVFDEASQITVSDAVGALARGKAAVVVGDRRQLPPTTFFQRLEDGDVDLDLDELEELESILDECSTAGLRTLRLRWHYRSRHESLIAFSNWHYYDNALYTFPAAAERSPRLGVTLVPVVDGVYDRSRTRTNRKEAESVVADLVARLRQAIDPRQAPSFGIVTFSQAQQALVETLLDEERRADPALEAFFGAGVPEPVFVKNLENVQGDERDVVLFSICYGPDAHGRVAMSFGPLNAAGGERRLNVAITRARQQVVVHATLRHEQIDLARTDALGVKHLKTFLDYAARGPQAIAEALVLEGSAQTASPFELDVAESLRTRGHEVVSRVGCSGYRVDLAVRDPDDRDRFLLGIECDGAFYRAATTARDRDRLRPGVLSRLGWQLCRVWVSDWRRSRERELARLEQRIAEAHAARDRGATAAADVPPAATSPDDGAAIAVEAAPVEAVTGGATETQAPVPSGTPASAASAPDASAAAAARAGMPKEASCYAAAAVARLDVPFEAAAPERLTAVIAAVLAAEAPIHGDLLVRRVAAAFDLARTTARTRSRVLALARELPAAHRPVERDEFLWPADLDPAQWLGFRFPDPRDDATRREVEHIPPEEIVNAAVHVVRTQVGLGRQDLLRQTGLLLGFARLGTRVKAALASGIDAAIARAVLTERDGKVTLGA